MAHSVVTPPELEPLSVSPKRAAELTGACLATVHDWLRQGLVEVYVGQWQKVS